MVETVELKTKVDVSRIFNWPRDIADLKSIVEDCDKLMELHPGPLHPEADRRVITLEFLSGATSFDQRAYSINDYKGEDWLDGTHYYANELR